MICVCSYCRKSIYETEPYDDKRITHGICPPCYDYFLPKLLEMDFCEHLDQYEIPIMMVNSEVRLVGVNQAMTSFLGTSKEKILGLLGGELMGCRYASMPGGCGQTIHCGGCTIRQSIGKALTAGTDLLDIPAYLDRNDQRVHFRLSLFYRWEFIRVSIDKVVGAEPLPFDSEVRCGGTETQGSPST
jgi:hypothetical protein